VLVSLTLQGVDFTRMTDVQKSSLKTQIVSIIIDSVSHITPLAANALNVALSPGSVKVDASIFADASKLDSIECALREARTVTPSILAQIKPLGLPLTQNTISVSDFRSRCLPATTTITSTMSPRSSTSAPEGGDSYENMDLAVYVGLAVVGVGIVAAVLCIGALAYNAGLLMLDCWTAHAQRRGPHGFLTSCFGRDQINRPHRSASASELRRVEVVSRTRTSKDEDAMELGLAFELEQLQFPQATEPSLLSEPVICRAMPRSKVITHA